MNRHFAFLALAVALVACEEPSPAEPSTALHVQVAPLSLTGIGNAEYTVVVRNSVSEVVWSETVTSDQFGDGVGSISYVGPCDALRNPHTVTLTLDKLWDSGNVLLTSPADYKDPGPITRSNITCVENADVPVVFSLTIIRAAHQGFFDVAVNFKDVFCSAKVDCKDELLFDGDTRGPTVVMTLACTSGRGANGPEPTWMYLSDVTLTCVGDPGTVSQTLSIAAVTAPGNQGVAPPLLFDWAEYQGQEGFGDVDKCYWNHAFGLDLDAIGDRTCTLGATATASDVALGGHAIAGDVVWPVINFAVEVVKDRVLCGPNPLDGDASDVWTSYVTPTSTPRPLPFPADHRCGGDDPAPLAFTCSGPTDATFQPTTAGNGQAVQVTVGGVTSVPYPLPSGATLDDKCCLDACCGQQTPP